MINITVRSPRVESVKKNAGTGFNIGFGFSMVNAMEKGIIGSGNYRKQWRIGQGAWKPLSAKYVEEKIERGFSPQIWKLSGATLAALSQPSNVSSAISSVPGRVISVMVNSGYFVEVGWQITTPAASGWPDRRRLLQSMFPVVNQTRPFIEIVGPEAVAITQKHLDKIVSDYFKKVFRW